MLPSLTWLFMGYSKKFGSGILKETTKKPLNNLFGGQRASLLLPQEEPNQMERRQKEDISETEEEKRNSETEVADEEAIVKRNSPHNLQILQGYTNNTFPLDSPKAHIDQRLPTTTSPHQVAIDSQKVYIQPAVSVHPQDPAVDSHPKEFSATSQIQNSLSASNTSNPLKRKINIDESKGFKKFRTERDRNYIGQVPPTPTISNGCPQVVTISILNPIINSNIYYSQIARPPVSPNYVFDTAFSAPPSARAESGRQYPLIPIPVVPQQLVYGLPASVNFRNPLQQGPNLSPFAAPFPITSNNNTYNLTNSDQPKIMNGRKHS